MLFRLWDTTITEFHTAFSDAIWCLTGEEKEHREGTHDRSRHESRRGAWSDDTHSSLLGKPWPRPWCSRGSSSHWSLHRPGVARCHHLLEGGCHWARREHGFHSGFLVCRRWAWHPLPFPWSGTTPHPHGCHKEGDLETHQIDAPCSSTAHSNWCKQNKDLELGMKRHSEPPCHVSNYNGDSLSPPSWSYILDFYFILFFFKKEIPENLPYSCLRFLKLT